MRGRVFLLILPALLALPGPGCETVDDLVPEPVVHTPLPFDPTEKYEIGPWWSNGEQMLRLDEAGSYALYGDQNRYHKPAQRGRWSQKSYAVLRLEPYERFRRPWIRVAVSRIEGEIALSVPDLAPMFAIDGPPTVAEDGLLGTWTDSMGTLTLGDDRRYSFSPAWAEVEEPAFIAGHRGKWRLEDDHLILTPDPPNMGPYDFWLIEEEEEQVLRGRDVEFRPAVDERDARPMS